MDKLPTLGRIIGQVVGPTYAVYVPLIAKNASKIELTKRETFKYGAHPRQELDIYQPSATTNPAHDTSPRPLLVFLHGGGFANGDKVNEAQPLFYKNLGHFFADRAGLETICMNYRLIQHGAKFPSGAEDLETALKWIAERYQDQQRDVYLFGNSAGGIHVVHWLLEPAFHDFRRKIIAGCGGVKLSGALVVGALFNFKFSSPVLRQNLAAYLGDYLDSAAPVESLTRCAETGEFSSGPWPRLLIGDCALDPEDILKATPEFIERLRAAGSLEVDYLNIKGHNHISPPLALGSDIAAEEEWGHEFVSWIRK
ncbi:uncharacterized protein A1O5_13247 [Cladophialophora psammophila CBS 110553]|uniref:BD-FAE-like domain-containing protein n=1 Tax=Cladophialophora psammophila CBS 110553 TaxID=1182543 RepID=W9VMW1_9EURO|nr:uncharacterized protein A1O5_13247 [Cladophialophora psammophila CBS 110553]EXJ53471.1 hypothetical protein A1O5_13247 [Cladophialophora psammophila CBS 110553]